MQRHTRPKLASLETLLEAKRGKLLPLPRKLARLYGGLRMPVSRTRPYVYSNFVTTLDAPSTSRPRWRASPRCSGIT